MVLRRIQWGVFLLCCVFCTLCLTALSDTPEVSVTFLQTPPQFSRLNTATFAFDALLSGQREACSNCSFSCKLDDGISSDCGRRNVSFEGLTDGYHSLRVCTNVSHGLSCGSYNWTVDTIHPTAYISPSSSFTNAANVTVHISFSEPCAGGGGFACQSVSTCNLLVYGAGQVIPHTLQTLQPNMKYSIVVQLSTDVQYGRAILVMDRGFCTDNAGNRFIRPENSSNIVHFDRRTVFASLRTHVPERLLQIDGETRTVQATNCSKNLKVYLYFTAPVLNTSTEVMRSINVSHGSLRPINSSNLANRRFGYMIEDIPSVTILTVSLKSSIVISRQGAPVSPVAPAIFLYDSKRPSVSLTTTSKRRTRAKNIAVTIKFMKPVFGFSSSYVSVSGGTLDSLTELSKNLYIGIIQAFEGIVSVRVPQNVTADIAGNPNLDSNVLQVRNYSMPMISSILCIFVTAFFIATCLVAGLLTVSTASLLSSGTFPRSSAMLTTNATRNLFRIVCYIQVFALSRWLSVTLPFEYYEFTRCIEWSIPYFTLPWESDHILPPVFSPNTSISSRLYRPGVNSSTFPSIVQLDEDNSKKAGVIYGAPLTAMEYKWFLENQNLIPQAEYISNQETLNGWRSFKRSMFWSAVIGGSLILLHVLLLLMLKFRKSNSKVKNYGALVLPRLEIFLISLALPCVCLASAAIIKGGTTLGAIIGIVLMIFVSSLLLTLFLFLSFGITLGKLLQYKEVHRVGQKFHWYQELVRVTLGPGKRGQWTWINQPNSVYLIKFGPLFEDLRGPPKYMLSMIAGGGHLPVDRIIASDDENEDAEAPFIQKLFGILRIYYTLLESIRRFMLGVFAGLNVESSSSSKGPIITLLGLSSFQLFFLVLKKPFIKKKVQLVEIISIACEVGMFATCLVVSERDFSLQEEKTIGIFMLCLFILGYVALLANEWYALFKQIRRLDTSDNTFKVGLRTTLVGFLLIFVPGLVMKNLGKWLPEDKGGRDNGEISRLNTTMVGRYNISVSRSSSTSDKPWQKQLREMAKASFKEGRGSGGNDPSTSNTRWSGFWRGKGSGSSSKTPSSDYKTKPRSLYKDMEAIFASK